MLQNALQWLHEFCMQPLQFDARLSAAEDNSITHAAAAPSNLDAAITLRYATTASRNAKNNAHRKNHPLQNTEEEPITLGPTPAATAAHRRYLSSPPAATLHGKTQGFVLRLPHTALHQCIVMWCRVSQFYLSVTRTIASQLPLINLQYVYVPIIMTHTSPNLCGLNPHDISIIHPWRNPQ